MKAHTMPSWRIAGIYAKRNENRPVQVGFMVADPRGGII